MAKKLTVDDKSSGSIKMTAFFYNKANKMHQFPKFTPA